MKYLFNSISLAVPLRASQLLPQLVVLALTISSEELRVATGSLLHHLRRLRERDSIRMLHEIEERY